MKSLIIESYLKRNDISVSHQIAEAIFEDLVLLLKQVYQWQKAGLLTEPFLFTSDISYLDLLWHEMILNTRYYQQFCQDHFGEFLHHDPLADDLVQASTQELNFEKVGHQIESLAQQLGDEFILRIYQDYPRVIQSCAVKESACL